MSQPQRQLPPAYPANGLAWVDLGTGELVPVAAVRDVAGRVLVYPGIGPARLGQRGRALQALTRMDRWVLVDNAHGMLPIYSTTWPMAHAIAQDWARALRSGGVQPRDYETVRTWA
ncbi:MAG: hypothetical protein K0R87_3525 [Pseudonocardia sp.]|nr:hypothetical protein [Pseudonocardia sp.]